MKRIITLCLAFVMVLTILDTMVAYCASLDSGTYGDFEFYSYGDKIEITGYTGAGGEVVIPESINNISVKIIGEDAFRSDFCSKITSIAIPNTITYIGVEAFSNCTQLASITIPSSVTSISASSFNYSGITDIQVDINSSTYSSENGVLFNKDKTIIIRCPSKRTGEYIIPNGVINIDGSAFYNCWLTSIIIPSSVTSIGHGAFAYSHITSLVIPDSVTNIDDSAFCECTLLTSITISNNVTSIDAWAFAFCIRLTTITLPASVTSIEKGAFISCENLSSITIPNSVKSIENNAFEGCDNLKLTFYVYPNSYALNYVQQNGYKYTIKSDIDQLPWAVPYIQDVITKGIMSARIDKNGVVIFNSAANATRADFADALFNYMGLQRDGSKTFTDTANHWAKDKISKLADSGLMKGISETEFAPDDPITREQIATILNRAIKPIASSTDFKYQDDAFISDWAKDSVYASYSAGWIKGDDLNNFNPSAPATRAELAVIFSRLANANIESTQE